MRASSAWALGLAITVFGLRAAAEEPAPAEREEPRAAPAQPSWPQAHFEAALVHYRAGRYRAAIEALRAAIALDPDSKDLFYNLALVHEKLGELDAAIAALQRYVTLEADATEIERASQAIERMRGARSELSRVAPAAAWVPAPAPPLDAPEPSRLDGWLLATSGVSVAAAVVGIVFGVRALTLDPGSNPRTDANTSIDDLRERGRRAERSAAIADVGFAVSLAAGAASAALFFGREPARHGHPARSALGVRWGATF